MRAISDADSAEPLGRGEPAPDSAPPASGARAAAA
jgi:hypothetical protein